MMDPFKSESCTEEIENLEMYLLHDDPSLVDMVPYPLVPNGLSDTPPQQLVQMPVLPISFFPVSPVGPPERYPVSGPAQFVVQVNTKEINKKKYVFSHRLNRIYVDNNTDVAVEFNWNRHAFPNPMYVRATVVFADEAQAQKRVETCVQHNHSAKANGKTEVVAMNVLVSSRVDFTNSDVYYCGDPNSMDSWLSVLVRFNKTSDEPCRHAYQFRCKNSCTSGINRRGTEIIFTLEDESGRVHGRQCVGARACAGPIRDLRRDEKEAGAVPPAKKRRIDTDAGIMPVLPQLPIADLDAMKIGLGVMLNVMEVIAPQRATDPQTDENYKKSIAAFKKYLGDLKKPPSS